MWGRPPACQKLWQAARLPHIKKGTAMAKLVHYSGQVQGVGFRMTAVRLSRRYPGVRGWVRNLPDGRVELFADGSASAVDSFLGDVRERMADYITEEETTEQEADASLTGFDVRY